MKPESPVTPSNAKPEDYLKQNIQERELLAQCAIWPIVQNHTFHIHQLYSKTSHNAFIPHVSYHIRFHTFYNLSYCSIIL